MKEIYPNKDYTLTAPLQYITRSNIIEDSGRFILRWGKNVLVSGGTRAMESLGNKLYESLDEAKIRWNFIHFGGECCTENIYKIINKAKEMKADAIIGVGGGKSVDTAKAAASKCGIPVICIPTIAATCAAASPLSIVYTNEGVHFKDVYLDQNPNLVLVDPEVIGRAPLIYIESGIIDSLSKWYEGRVAIKRFKKPDLQTNSSIKLSALLNDIMEKEAVAAVNAIKNNEINDSVLTVIELNIYLAAVIQSIGKLTRGAAAHCIHSGLSIIPESHEILHGFKVGYGIIVQLIMEGTPIEEIKHTVALFRQLDLEPSLKGLKLHYTPEILKGIADKSLTGDTMKFLPFEVKEETIITAMEKLEEMIDNL